MPGQFNTLAGITIDKNNRVFTTEQYPGRMQMFRYFTDEEARAEKAKRDAEEEKKKAVKSGSAPKEAEKSSEAKSQ